MAQQASSPSPFQVLISDLQAELRHSTRDAQGNWNFTQKTHTLFKGDLFTSLNANNQVYLLAHLPKEYRVDLCKSGFLPWWALTSLAVAQGNIDDVKNGLQLMQNNGAKIVHNSLLTWALTPNDLGKHTGKPSADVLKLLLERGADPNYKEGAYIKEAINTKCDVSMLLHLIDFGADGAYIVQSLSEIKDSSPHYVKAASAAILTRTLRIKASPDTLEDIRYPVDHTGGASQIKTVFNFKSRRVTEVYQFQQQPPQILSFPFSDYDLEYLQEAHAHLTRLGGKPPELPDGMRKGTPVLAKMQIIKKTPA